MIKNSYKYLCWISGLISILLGLFVILGWYFDYEFLIHVTTLNTTTSFTVALLFIFTGLALIFNDFLPGITLFMTLIIILISSLSLIELFTYNVHFNKLFFSTSAPNSIISFFLISIVLAFLRLKHISQATKTIVTLSASMIVTSFGLIALVGSLYSLPFTSEWNNFKAMATQSAFGFSIIGISLVVYVWKTEKVWAQRAEVVFPSLITVLGTLTFVLLWQFLIKEQFKSNIFNLIPNLVLIAGLSITYMATVLYRSLTISRNRLVELQDSETHIRSIIETAGEAYIAANSESRIINWNKQAEIIFGWNKKEVIGKLLTETIIPAKFHQAHLTGMKNYLKTGEAPILNKRIEITAVRKNGEEFPAELIVSPLPYKSEKIFNAFLRDITKRKELEKIKNEFISLASHELRTPLTVAHGAVTLLSNFIKPENKQIENLLLIARESTAQLIELINNLLDIEKIEVGKAVFKLETFSLQEILKKSVRLNTVFADKFNIKLYLIKNKKYKYIVNVDVDRIMQVMNNLISNAIRYSFKGGTVKIKASLINDSIVRVSVTDKGIGIPPEFTKTIFQKFARANNSVNSFGGGTGLGLHISKSIIEQLGGEMGFATEQNQTTFYFTLPLVRVIKKKIKTSTEASYDRS